MHRNFVELCSFVPFFSSSVRRTNSNLPAVIGRPLTNGNCDGCQKKKNNSTKIGVSKSITMLDIHTGSVKD